MRKRLISLLLMVCIVASLLSGLTVSAYADGNTVSYTMQGGDTVIGVCTSRRGCGGRNGRINVFSAFAARKGEGESNRQGKDHAQNELQVDSVCFSCHKFHLFIQYGFI